MNTYVSRSRPSSSVPSVADLDGYTFPSHDYYGGGNTNYLSPEHDQFGFDPPSKPGYARIEASDSPANPNDAAPLAGWPGFERDDDEKLQGQLKAAMELVPGVPKTVTVLSRYGQVTPPRSNSATSVDNAKEHDQPPKSESAGRKRKSKATAVAAAATDKPSRKRKTSRKSDPKSEDIASAEDEKRKVSLEKNRVAAAKCRVNKKEKTEALQRDSHEKAVQNAFLKETVIRMKEEIQHVNALLIAHASSEGCKRPEELHKYLSQVGQDYFSHHHMGIEGQAYSTYAALARQMQQSNGQGLSLSRNPAHNQALIHNPPLPEFNQTADFDVQTPQPGD